MVLLLAWAAQAQQTGHPLMPTLAEWVTLSSEAYHLDGLSPSRASAAFVDRDGHWVEASMGAITSEQGWPTRPGRVELVVGHGLDSSRYRESPTDPIARPNFVVDPVDLAIARDLWLTTDYSFKAAIKQFQIKTAALAQMGTPYPQDWSEAEPVQFFDPTPRPEIDRDWLHEIAVQGSQEFRALGGLRNGRVYTNMLSEQYVFTNSEGARITRTDSRAVVYAWADVLRDDGVQVYEYDLWVASTVEDLPPSAEILREIRQLGQRVMGRADAPVVDFYEGPVVFEGDAAVDLFRYLAIPEVLGTPPVPRATKTYAQQMRDKPRQGRRLLGAGWEIVDDPTRTPDGLAGGFSHDREGVAAQRVQVVDDGYVRDLLMSRVPRHDLTESNGHCRGDIHGVWSARESIWRVTPARGGVSDRAFDKTLERTMREAGTDTILVVRSMERGRAGALPSPADAVWRAADGTEVPVLALDFQHVDRRSLRDVVAAVDDSWVRPYLAPINRYATAKGDRGLPAVGIGPQRILIDQMELVFPGGNRQPHVLAPPPP